MNKVTANTPGGTSANTLTPALLDAKQCAALLGCSTRHWARLVDMGNAPASIRLGRCVKWDRRLLESWIADGCRPVRNSRGVR
jgi:predicted DNA-binding transcriptional regulator AlpA